VTSDPKIRLGFDSSIGAHRQLLVTADSNTTNQFDIGYDAQCLTQMMMFWDISNSQFVIQSGTNLIMTNSFGLAVAKMKVK
jgi:hypothetical protein